MIRLLSFILIAIVIHPILTTDASASEERDITKPILIATYKEDITGDGLKETIELKGVLFSNDSNYYREIWADIKSEYSNGWKVVYKGGYEPRLQFHDLNHDGIHNVLFQSIIEESSEVYNNQLHTIIDKNIKNITLPQQHYVNANFKEDFNIEILISPDTKPIIVQLKDQLLDYVQLGIYDNQGKLLKDTSVIIKPISSFKPMLISKSKGYGLISYQPISGAYDTDRLGTIETLWYYENDKWVVLKTEWVTSH